MFAEELNTVRGLKSAPKTDREHRSFMDALLERLAVGDENQRFEAGVLLEKEARPTDVPLLSAALAQHKTELAIELPIIRALGATKSSSAIEPLRSTFNSGNAIEQIVIIDALAQIPDQIVVNMLADSLVTGDNDAVHVRAASALGRIGGERAVYALNAVADTMKGTSEKMAARWALRIATKDVTTDRIDTDIDEGRQQNYYYKGMMYYVYRPAFRKDAPKDSWLLTCIHGADLDFEAIIDLCQPIAKQVKATLLVPFFDPVTFPEFDSFNLHGIRSDKRLFELVDHLGKHAEVKTKEIYILGFNAGGDFAQRLTYFYPERIARAAFNSTFFYPLAVEAYFPNGLKTTPLAPDLSVDFLKVIKTDFAIIMNPYQPNSKEFRAFLNSLSDYARRTQHTTRVKLRTMSEKGNNIGETAEIGKNFLFPKE